MTTWVVVAHKGGARLVAQDGDEGFEVIETVDHPEGRERDSQRGRASPSQRSARPSEPRDPSLPFAAELAKLLQRGRNDNRYRELVLIAAPRFLGLLRGALDPATAALVRGTLDKDFGGLNDRELIARLEAM